MGVGDSAESQTQMMRRCVSGLGLTICQEKPHRCVVLVVSFFFFYFFSSLSLFFSFHLFPILLFLFSFSFFFLFFFHLILFSFSFHLFLFSSLSLFFFLFNFLCFSPTHPLSSPLLCIKGQFLMSRLEGGHVDHWL